LASKTRTARTAAQKVKIGKKLPKMSLFSNFSSRENAKISQAPHRGL
jgi:hypothetical protein